MVIFLVLISFITVAGIYLSRVNIPVLEPKGPVADKEFRLLVGITAIMLIVAVPVFLLLAYVVWRYREDNPKRGQYVPDWEHSRWLEGLWWVIPTILILIVSVISWNASYALNPYRPILTSKKALVIQAVSLDWKWLFIYPDQHIASVNLVEFPLKTPVHFYLTSDAPMNSFWLPQLSGQIYTMAGMQTQLYLASDVIGNFTGRSANLSGAGFAGMQFIAKSVKKGTFDSWVERVKTHSLELSLSAYRKLERPSSYMPVTYYANPAKGLFGDIIAKYMVPYGQAHENMGGVSS